MNLPSPMRSCNGKRLGRKKLKNGKAVFSAKYEPGTLSAHILDAAGPFNYYGCVQHPDGTPWGEKKGDSFAFDPGVLVDDDGKVYLYVGHSPAPGFNKTILKLRGNRVEEAVCLELETDMLTVKSGEHPLFVGFRAFVHLL